MPEQLSAFATTLLAIGGSAFWAQVVGYASAVKDVRQKVAAATPGPNG